MPRENRKRGKKHKAGRVERAEGNDHPNQLLPSAEHALQDFSNSSKVVGVLDPDVKAYFLSVDDQLRDWQETSIQFDDDAGFDPNEERRTFFTAALSEMNGKELQLAADPDCSPVLERMLYSMDDFARRVFTDSFSGSWVQMYTNRFASHVCQTLFTVVTDTVARETRGIFPPPPASANESGELLSMTQLILNMCEEITSELPGLIRDPFASHVLRSLLLLLSPSDFAPLQINAHKRATFLRSKKSAVWKSRRGSMKAIIQHDTVLDSVGAEDSAKSRTPDSFKHVVGRFVDTIRNELDGNELRALGVDNVASPTLQMFLELEASSGKANVPESMIDRILMGIITDIHAGVTSSASPYVEALLRDTTSSHLLESILSVCSNDVAERFWDCYIFPDLPKVSLHPVANFVVAKGVGRLDERRLKDAVTQLESIWSRLYKHSRLGVLTAIIDRAGQISAQEAEVVEATCSMVGIVANEERRALVPCLLRMITYNEYQDTVVKGEMPSDGDQNAPDGEGRDVLVVEPKLQGSLLLQSLFRLHEPYNLVAFESLYSHPPTELVTVAQNATSSRLFDVALKYPTVPLRLRKQLVAAFIGQFHILVDDRIGSRVADCCWQVADPYLKEKIARSLIPHEQFLQGSHFGRFFTRNLKLPLLQRKPDQWKALQLKNKVPCGDADSTSVVPPEQPHSLGGKESTSNASTSPTQISKHTSKRKSRNDADGDEIDLLFKNIGANKRARGTKSSHEIAPSFESKDPALDSILGAIKSAPKNLNRG